MATPHIAAIAGLMRSVNPLLTYQSTATLLQTGASDVSVQTYQMFTQSQAPFLATQVKHDASAAVQAALDYGKTPGGNANRRTPLFGFYSSTRGGRFYTTNPQAGKSAISGTLIPTTNSDTTLVDGKQYLPVGNAVEGYWCFPSEMVGAAPISCQAKYIPRALVEVYTAEVSPFSGVTLLPLYRLSKAGSGVVRYTYETDEGSKNLLVTSSGWKVDGVEGFVLPGPQPGTVKLCRKFNGSDYVLFPGSGTNGDDCSADSECHLTLASSCGPGGYSEPPAGASLGYVFPLARFSNISVRAWVGTDNDVAIAGFIIAGTAPKKVVIRGRGPSLVPFGITNALVNPFLHLVSGQTVIGSNDDWGSSPNWQEIQAAGYAPTNSLESAILVTLNPGAYTAILSGVDGGTGVGIVEVFEVDELGSPIMNLSTRAMVLTGDNVMIGGFIISGGSPKTVVVRVRGPSLVPAGILNALVNPLLQLVSGQTLIESNDDWGSAPNASQIQASGFAPGNALESTIMMTLNPGAYTAIASGVGGGTGVAILELFVP